MRILISWGDDEVAGELNDTPNAKAVYAALPVTATAYTWGEEVYFDLPASAELAADARDVVEPGTICYWVQGTTLALPFGPTPASEGDECRLVTDVNVIGVLEGDPKVLGSIRDGDVVTVRAGE